MRLPLLSTLFPYTTLFRSLLVGELSLETCPVRRRIALTPLVLLAADRGKSLGRQAVLRMALIEPFVHAATQLVDVDRKSTRLNSSHVASSYAVFCLNKQNA